TDRTTTATSTLSLHDALPIFAVELSPEFAALLETKYAERSFTVAVGPFEDVALDPASFDLVVAATSFHWVPTEERRRGHDEVERSEEHTSELQSLAYLVCRLL